MSNLLFVNSKAALVFAGLTILGTLMMVGPGGGLLGQAKARFGRQSEPVAEAPPSVVREKPKVVEPLDPAAGWGGTGGDAVFGDYAAREEVDPTEAPQADSAPPPSADGPTVRRASVLPAGTGGPVQADSLGTLVPRDGAPEALNVARSIDIEAE